MSIEFHCPTCNQLLRVDDASAGREAKCPSCGATAVVPAAATPESRNPFQSPQQDYTAAGQSGVAAQSGAVTAVAVVNFIIGGLQFMCGGLICVAGGLFADVFEEALAEHPDVQLQNLPMALGALVLAVGVFVLVVGLLQILAGYGVLQRRQWGRILTLVLGGLAGLGAVGNLMSMDVGSAVMSGGYAIFVFVVLLNRQYAAEFH